MKFCKDCKYYESTRVPRSPFSLPAKCTHPDSHLGYDIVHGTSYGFRDARMMRQDAEKCGRFGKLYVEKEHTKSLVSRIFNMFGVNK